MVTTPLQRARSLELPTRDATLHRDRSVQRFWAEHRELLQAAWEEWGTTEQREEPGPAWLDSALLEAVEAAWVDPAKEYAVRELWEEVAPGVHQARFVDSAHLGALRGYLQAAEAASIPVRPPYGIVLNRKGAMLDPRSDGFLAAPGFQVFYKLIMNRVMRPVGRLLFPEVTGFDGQSFGFSIQYQAGMDTSIRPHTDASSITLNINLNLPDEPFEGSEVRFFDPRTGKSKDLVFEPGMAVIHRGHLAHAALPITKGERTNLVLWSYGRGGRVAPRAGAVPTRSAHERWTVPDEAPDGYAPF